MWCGIVCGKVLRDRVVGCLVARWLRRILAGSFFLRCCCSCGMFLGGLLGCLVAGWLWLVLIGGVAGSMLAVREGCKSLSLRLANGCWRVCQRCCFE